MEMRVLNQREKNPFGITARLQLYTYLQGAEPFPGLMPEHLSVTQALLRLRRGVLVGVRYQQRENAC